MDTECKQNSDVLTFELPNEPKRIKSKKDASNKNVSVLQGCLQQKYNANVRVVPIVNDLQHLQFCAVHAINNLLQITKDSMREKNGDGDHKIFEEQRSRLKSDDTTRRLVLVKGELYTQSKMDFASKKELDTIADKMSDLEMSLMYGDEKSDNDKKNIGSSLWRNLRSNHRTLCTGNYSFEVLEAALSKRHVALNWFNVKSDMNPLHLSKFYDAKDEDLSQVVIGYVINSVKEAAPYSFKSLAHYAVPFIFSGRHWSVITKIRVVRYVSHHDCGSKKVLNSNSNSGEVISYEAEQWYKIDSEDFNATELRNDAELLEVLKKVKEKDGNVFQAVAQSLDKMSI